MKGFASILVTCLLSITAIAQPDLAKRGAAITVKVRSFDEAQNALTDLVTKHHGTLADRHRVASPTGQHSGWTRIEIPKTDLDAFLVEIRAIGKIYGERSSLDDSSDEFVSLGHRAERLQQHEQRLNGILGAGKRLRGSDILYVQERLFRASVDEDALTQQKESLARQAATSSVIVDFYEPLPIKQQPRGVLGRTSAAVTGALRGLALGLLDSLETILRWLVWLLIFYILWRIFRKPVVAAIRRFWSTTGFAPDQGTVKQQGQDANTASSTP